MHRWGDGFKYFYEVEQAAYDIGEFCRKWGRIHVGQTKEKWGTARVYCSFGYLSLHSLLYPGYHYKRHYWPDWLWAFDIYYLSKALNFFARPLHRYQQIVYRLGYWKALKKFPMIREEILAGADYPEYLEGL